MGFFRLFLIATISLILPAAASAQDKDQTLADIRQELTFLNVEIQRLKSELNTTGLSGMATGTGSVLDRVDALEAEVRRLNGATEKLQFRLERVVEDGTRRIGDLEFRLVELEGGDVSQLGETSTLGGDSGATAPVDVPVPAGGEDLAVGERPDYEAAKAAFDAGDDEQAITLLDAFIDNYPGGPLTSRAHFYKAEALSRSDQWKKAARSYLNAFSGAPGDALAPDALFKLGVSLDRIGQREEACLTLNEVGSRYPEAPAVDKARAEMATLQCN